MKYTLNDLIHSKGITEIVQQAVMALRHENEELRARIEAMERQEPAAWCATDETETVVEALGMNQSRRFDTALYLAPGAQPAPSFADAYQGAMEEVAIWKRRALEAEDLNRKFVAEINGPAYMGEPAQPAPSIPEGWKPIPEKHPTFDLVDLRLADGSVLCACVPQSDGDYWWNGPSGEVFIDPKYAPATHWRLAADPEAKP